MFRHANFFMSLLLFTLCFSDYSWAGGGGCGESPCPAGPPTQILKVCRITEVNANQNFTFYKHNSFPLAKNAAELFQVDKQIEFKGGEYEGRPTAIYYAGFTDSFVASFFEYYSLNNPTLNSEGVAKTRLSRKLTWSEGPGDTPLISNLFFDVEILLTEGVFDLIAKVETSWNNYEEVPLLSGQLACN